MPLDKHTEKDIIMFESLIKQEKGEREKVLTEAINKVQNIVTHDYLVIIISDFIHYSEKIVKYLARLSKHNDVLLKR